MLRNCSQWSEMIDLNMQCSIGHWLTLSLCLSVQTARRWNHVIGQTDFLAGSSRRFFTLLFLRLIISPLFCMNCCSVMFCSSYSSICFADSLYAELCDWSRKGPSLQHLSRLVIVPKVSNSCLGLCYVPIYERSTKRSSWALIQKILTPHHYFSLVLVTM